MEGGGAERNAVRFEEPSVSTVMWVSSVSVCDVGQRCGTALNTSCNAAPGTRTQWDCEGCLASSRPERHSALFPRIPTHNPSHPVPARSPRKGLTPRRNPGTGSPHPPDTCGSRRNLSTPSTLDPFLRRSLTVSLSTAANMPRQQSVLVSQPTYATRKHRRAVSPVCRGPALKTGRLRPRLGVKG